MLQEMGMPSYVPVVTMENTICATNWTAMMTEVVSLVDMNSVTEEVGDEIYQDDVKIVDEILLPIKLLYIS
jgi:hypothetical protein